MKYLGSVLLDKGTYQCYRNKDGFIEMYRTKNPEHIGSITTGKLERFVTTCTEMEQLYSWFKKKKKAKRYNPHKDPKQLKIQ